MVRTKADIATKAVGAKALRKRVNTPTSQNSISGSDTDIKSKNGGGNPYHPRETPEWQKPITTFFGSTSSEPKGSNSLNS